MATYYLSSTASDLGGGADFSAALVKALEAASTRSVSLAKGGTQDSFGFTPSGDPGALALAGTRTHTAEVNVTTASTEVFASVSFARVSSAGTVLAGGAAFAAEQGMSAGVFQILVGRLRTSLHGRPPKPTGVFQILVGRLRTRCGGPARLRSRRVSNPCR